MSENKNETNKGHLISFDKHAVAHLVNQKMCLHSDLVKPQDANDKNKFVQVSPVEVNFFNFIKRVIKYCHQNQQKKVPADCRFQTIYQLISRGKIACDENQRNVRMSASTFAEILGQTSQSQLIQEYRDHYYTRLLNDCER